MLYTGYHRIFMLISGVFGPENVQYNAIQGIRRRAIIVTSMTFTQSQDLNVIVRHGSFV